MKRSILEKLKMTYQPNVTEEYKQLTNDKYKLPELKPEEIGLSTAYSNWASGDLLHPSDRSFSKPKAAVVYPLSNPTSRHRLP